MAAFVLLFLLVVNSAVYSKEDPVLTKQTQQQILSDTKSFDTREIFLSSLRFYAPVYAETPQCRNDSRTYLEAALRNDPWAIQMFDASSKLKLGKLDGNYKSFGNFDSCLNVATPEHFAGQLCLVEPNDDAMKPIPLIQPLISVCVPSSCSYQDVQTHMDVALKPFSISVKLTPRSCSTRHPEPWETKDYVAACVICVLVSLVLISSFYDCLFHRGCKVKRRTLLSSFSLYRNIPKLSTKGDGNEVSAINGLRFVTILWIVLGHRYMVGFAVPGFSKTNSDTYLQHWAMSPVHSVAFAVEIFFVISGLLVVNSFFKMLDEKKNIFATLQKFYFHRYIRTTPVYAVLLLVDATILYHLSDGPAWKAVLGNHRDVCSKNGWTGLLHISNYYSIITVLSCTPHMWFLNTDMQLFLVSPLLLIPLYKKPKLGLCLIFGCLFTSIAASYLNASYHELKAGGMFTVNDKTFRTFDLEYTKTHVRSSSFLMGQALGYFVYRHKQGFLKVNLSKITLAIGWLLTTIMLIIPVFSIAVFQNIDYSYPQYIDSMCIALPRPIFSLGIVWVIFVSITGNGGFVNKMLSLPFMRPLATLTFGIYMTHVTFQIIDIGRARAPVDFSPFDLIVKSVSDVAACIVLATVMFLVVEAPFVEIYKWLFSEDGQNKKRN